MERELAIRFDRVDRAIAGWMDRFGRVLLRISLGVVFVWFGALKLFEGLSPAAPLVAETVPWFDPDWFIPVLGVWEVLIGLGLFFRPFIRFALLLLFLQMPGTLLPLVAVPEAVYQLYPFQGPLDFFVLTTEGQYIIKNFVLISAALVVGGTVRHDVGSDPAGRRKL